jgi:uncharacterized membrane protein
VLRERLGERGYLAFYSALALASFGWVILAFVTAPAVALWRPPLWSHWVPVVLMPLASILLIGGLATRNPTAIGQERTARADDPAPGILRITRHPVMWSIGLWSLGHLAANGDAAGLVFFGAMALLSLGGTRLIDARKRLALGTDWARLAEVTSNLPFAALIQGRTKLPWRELGLPAAAGLLLYLVLLQAHPLFAGVAVTLR